jgi:hypothetical protein
VSQSKKKDTPIHHKCPQEYTDTESYLTALGTERDIGEPCVSEGQEMGEIAPAPENACKKI